MHVAIILVVHDPSDAFTLPEALPAAIRSLELLKENLELILVNNLEISKCPKTTRYLRELANSRPQTKLVENGCNLGCAAGFNRGAAVAEPGREIPRVHVRRCPGNPGRHAGPHGRGIRAIS